MFNEKTRFIDTEPFTDRERNFMFNKKKSKHINTIDNIITSLSTELTNLHIKESLLKSELERAVKTKQALLERSKSEGHEVQHTSNNPISTSNIQTQTNSSKQPPSISAIRKYQKVEHIDNHNTHRDKVDRDGQIINIH